MTDELRTAAAERFAEVADRFCRRIDRRARSGPDAFLNAIHLLLPELYSAALELRLGNRSDEEYAPLPDVWQPVYDDLTARLGKWNVRWEVFNPYHVESDDPITGTLADDLAETYRWCKKGMAIWSLGGPTAREDAVWEWRFGFEILWGHHAIDTLRALHARSFDPSNRERSSRPGS